MSTTSNSLRFSFGMRLTLMIGGLVLLAIVVISSLTYIQFRTAFTEDALGDMDQVASAGEQQFTDWLEARQDEMRYLAGLNPAKALERDDLNHLLETISDHHGYYDTIFVVQPNGQGLVGVEYDGATRVLSRQEAAEFNVPDRAWFQSAMDGNPVFSQPVISRATGNRVSTVAIPIVHDNGNIVGVMRGAVDLDNLTDQIRNLAGDGMEAYLVNENGEAVTAADSFGEAGRRVATQAARAIADGNSGTGIYNNAAGTEVVGAYAHIPMLGWGLVIEQDATTATAELRQTFWSIIVTAVMIIAIAIGAALFISRRITATLGGDPDYAAETVTHVSEGNLTTDVELRKGDTSSLLYAINAMKDNLRRMIGQVSGYSDELASSATEMSQISQETDSVVQQQTEELNSAATAMNEMTQTVEEVSRNAQSAADSAEEASDEAGNGRHVVQQTSTSIKQLHDDVKGASEVMDALKEGTDQIGTVLGVIRDVADQTNLLALNASIEAARAGESGRGFAVVADEVRNLAKRTEESTAEIQDVIDKLQSRADEAVTVMKQSSERASHCHEQSDLADKALDKVADAVSNINDMIQQIASATEEQTTAAREINENIQRINDLSEQSLSSVGQSSEASDVLSRLAEQLRSEVKQFTV